MKHTPPVTSRTANPLLLEDLLRLRRWEQFDPNAYVVEKVKLLAVYFKAHRLNAAVVAVSGGVDSACVLGLLKAFERAHPDVLKKIVAVTLPAFESAGVTHQEETVSKAQQVNDVFGVPLQTLNMSDGLSASTRAILLGSSAARLSPWAEGQVVPYLRTAWLYGMTASLSDQGFRSVLMGTTNKDEGAYLGFFGKASDGLVDIQPISDLHKANVWSVARSLGVPEAICAAVPTGDMYDARSDEDVFGASYDEVEWAIRRMEMSQTKDAKDAFEAWARGMRVPDEAAESIKKAMSNIDALHAYNTHKYLGGSPAVHLDVLPCRLKTGWRNNTNREVISENQNLRSQWVNPCSTEPRLKRGNKPIQMERGPQGVLIFRGVLSREECAAWLEWAKIEPWLRANEQGKAKGVKSPHGSWRKTTESTENAEELYKRLSEAGLPRHYSPIHPASDCAKGGIVWTRTAMSQVWRWIKYSPADRLVPHYDDTFVHSSHKRTLSSVVMYLTEGVTEFMTDPRFPATYDDWLGQTNVHADYRVHAQPGDVVVFDHRLFHAGPTVDQEKVVVRSDLVYEKPNLGGAIEHH